MSRITTYLVGRDPGCHVHLDDDSVSDRHAEVVRLADGRLYVTDCASTNGTYIVRGEAKQPIGQDFLPRTARIRFGEVVMGANELDAACRSHPWWRQVRSDARSGRYSVGVPDGDSR